MMRLKIGKGRRKMAHSSKMIEFILTCSCQGAPELAVKEFSAVFPDKIHPVMLVGNKQILDEANKHQGTKLGELLLGISKNREKFAFYVCSEGDELELWDLKKGIRIP